ncbi:MAG: methylmalonyl-CoA epimerase [Nitrospirae bacterium]|nr:methylmalonyl-CoA epimerase [Nitrospirota bacterium]
MFKKVDHIGIAVPSLEGALKFYEEVLGIHPDHFEEVEEQKVRTAFIPVGETHIELLEPTSPDSPIAKFIDKRGPGIHHLALGVENLEGKLADCKAKGAQLIDEKPRVGAHGKKIAFIHPKSTGGVLLELCETPRKK